MLSHKFKANDLIGVALMLSPQEPSTPGDCFELALVRKKTVKVTTNHRYLPPRQYEGGVAHFLL